MAACLGLAAMLAGQSPAGAEDCGPVPLPGAAGPYDYVDPKFAWNLNDINDNHWVKVDANLADNRVHHALYELNYLLIRVPNHYEGLLALGRIERRHPGVRYIPAAAGMDEPLFFPPTPECYFDRAFRYRPKDPNLRLLFGMYYHMNDDVESAITQYQRAEEMDPGSSEIQYNLGLAHFDAKDYDAALTHARKAYQLGYPLPGLRNKLRSVGRWPSGDD